MFLPFIKVKSLVLPTLHFSRIIASAFSHCEIFVQFLRDWASFSLVEPNAQKQILSANLRNGTALIEKGILLNLFLAIIKLLGGIFGHTYALLADAAESFMDILSSSLVWIGFRIAARPPDHDHPFGHGKAEALAALFISLFILGTAGFIAYHAIISLNSGSALSPEWWTLPLLTLVIVLKIYFARRISRAGKNANSNALSAEGWHHLSDAITTAAAFIGVLLAIIGGPAWKHADAWAALIACVFIAANGIRILYKTIGDIMDAAVPTSYQEQVRKLALTIDGVLGIDKCRIRKSGFFHLVDIQVIVNEKLTVRQGHEIAHLVKDRLLASPLNTNDVSVHIEPPGGCLSCRNN